MSGYDSRRRLVLIGVDGMDFDLARLWLDRLPNLKRIAESGGFLPFRSVFPPDSIPAWITAYTGLDPSEHGILESVNYFAKGDDRLKVDTSVFKGRTFWDVVGRSGRPVCVINPFMAYPVWDVNGLMVNGPVFITGDIQASSPGLVADLTIPDSLGGIVDYPTQKTLRAFRDKVFADTREQGAFGRSLLVRMRPSLFFQTFLTMDRIQHFLWRYGDRGDPTHPGKNEFEDSILDFYQLIDAEIGEFATSIEPDDRLLVISDHGHGRRCTHCFNINEYLRRRGDLVSGKGLLSPARMIEFGKNTVLATMDRLGLQDYVRAVAKLIPRVRELKKGKHLTDNSRNRAWVSDFTGTNPFGGICINRKLVPNYDAFRDGLIGELSALEHEGKPVFLWLRKREEMYSGQFLERFPDILFEMQPSLGINWSLHTRLFTRNPTHKALSGGHKARGVIFSNQALNESGEASIEELFATIIRYFGLEQ